ncbi:succinate dehydrogenase / fumarate reductase cytochrome b subunit [Kineosphaera limosa]|uniref:Succinate dehydrogenase cytochrome b subunit n=1 Tax=Kineosphaera limosa NBRC 100340 TaxID=1184609 RepID=K6WND8_9MICO|nr:succinate dehydrogenase cytochrome b subunit [Kineosphaera limosa]NYE02097.1 succinate dehydrogenase / fumarate reductase cytochrome b subunit [Kineosphaera limosa]GAB95301.1 succinate dehydrogenase cytochrome b subunit [Kineosphaera limosa NBRC 100340]
MHSTIGLKIMMAVSGLFFVFFVLMHMYGNLKILVSHHAFDDYAHHLRVLGEPILPYEGGLWIFRILLLVALAAHAYSAFTLWSRANTARGTRYAVKKAAAASLSSKWMRWGGVALLTFIVFHLAQFTLMWINVGGTFDSPAERVVAAFQVPWLTLIYFIALAALAMHLNHGTFSALQTLGLTNTTKAYVTARLIGTAIAVIVVVGFAIPPLAILFGIIK